MSLSSIHRKKIVAVFRHAAELVANAPVRHPSGCCAAVLAGMQKHDVGNKSKLRNFLACYDTDVHNAFSALFNDTFGDGGYWFNPKNPARAGCGPEIREHRTLSLLIMADRVESGELDDLFLPCHKK